MKMGGFDPKYGYADDLTFYFKYGLSSDLADNAICFHKNPDTLKAVYRQSKWIGASIRSKLFTLPAISHLAPIAMILLSPLAIPYLSIKKAYKNKDFKILFPWMFIFMTARYFGTISGIFRKTYLGKNVR